MERSSNAAPTSASAINAQASAKLNAEKDALARRLRAVDATSLRHGVAAATSGGVVAMQAVQGKVAVTAVEKAAVRKAAQQRVREGQMSLSGRLFRLLEYLKVGQTCAC